MIITRRDAHEVIRLVRELEWQEICTHPLDVLWDRWDYAHFRRLRALAQSGDWEAFVVYLDTCGETRVRETVETLIKRHVPRWFRYFLSPT